MQPHPVTHRHPKEPPRAGSGRFLPAGQPVLF